MTDDEIKELEDQANEWPIPVPWDGAHKLIAALRESRKETAKYRGTCLDLRIGKCLGVIPDTFIVCGEGQNYCSAACQLTVACEGLRKALKEGIEAKDILDATAWVETEE